MAKSRSRRSGGGGASARRSSTRSESRKPAARQPKAVEVEIVEEEKGLGIDDGIIILTAILMLVAFVMIDYHRGKEYGEGMLFKGNYSAPGDAE